MTDRPSTSLFVMPADLLGEGVDQVVHSARHQLGVDAIALASVYHASRDVLAHSARHRVFQSIGGTSFPPTADWYDEGAAPLPMPEIAGQDLLEAACTAASKVGLAVDAWVVYLHADRWAGTASEGAVVNAFGDVYPQLRCPSAPQTERYARALTRDLVRHQIRRIVAEGLHWYPFEHGYHHERTGMVTTPRSARLLALCFCDACGHVAAEHGIDANGLAAWCRRAIDAELAGETRAAADDVPPELEALADLRASTVAGLVAACTEVAAAAGKEFVYLDLSAGIGGWAHGQVEGPLGITRGWELGVDVTRFGDGTGVAAAIYTRDDHRFAAEVAPYLDARAAQSLTVVLRPSRPDVESAASLTARLRMLRELGVGELAFYQYGLMSRAELDRLARANKEESPT